MKLPKCIVVGAKGFIGHHLFRFFEKKQAAVLGTHYTQTAQFAELNLKHPEIKFSTQGFEYAIIAAAKAGPLTCENNPDESYFCNVEAPLILGDLFLKRQIIPIYFSTDYIFDGKRKLYFRRSAKAPLNLYGKQKAELEKKALKKECLIFRLSKIYGIEINDNTLFDSMASSFEKNNVVKAATDQIFAPLFIGDLIEGAIKLMQQKKRGCFQFASKMANSRYEMAMALAEKLNFKKECIQKITLDDIQDGIDRPTQVRMKSDIQGISWKEGLNLYAKARKRNLG